MNFANLPSRRRNSTEIRGYRLEAVKSAQTEKKAQEERTGEANGNSQSIDGDTRKPLYRTASGTSTKSTRRNALERTTSATFSVSRMPTEIPVRSSSIPWLPQSVRKAAFAVWKLLRFVGPGFMVAVAYIDPGNYSTDVSAGAQTRFALLFMVLISNIFAVVLQSLAIRLGTVTGMDLAQNCRAHLPKWLNLTLYFFAESAIIATDIAEVIGSAIALNLLLHIPLVAGCAITILEVLVILFFYRPNGAMRGLKIFEYGMVALVLAVVVCFCIQLSLLTDTSVGEVFRGYIPSAAVVQGQGLYLSCGILGATVMPHSLYLGSGVVKPRVRKFDDDEKEQHAAQTVEVAVSSASSGEGSLTLAASHASANTVDDEGKTPYRPSLRAIKHCMTTSTIELIIALCIFALFVNSAILITAGASLSSGSTAAAAANADLFGIYDLLSSSISRAAATIFALALLLSGLSAGIVCTIAGQMVSEGAINWTIKPWLRQLMTRSLSITPSIIIAGAVGRDGLNAALNGTQVALSIILPFVSAPLVYFTCRNKYMTVGGRRRDGDNAQGEAGESEGEERTGMRNHWIVSTLAVLVWLVIVVMNVALLVFVGKGNA